MQQSSPEPGGPPGRRNNFDALRVFAAVGVVLSHGFLLAGGTYAQEPAFALSGGQTTIGGIAVLVFFVLSGFLITQSFDRAPGVWRFVRARVLRIMPGLATVVLVTALLLGPLCSTLAPAQYFASPEAFDYIAGNLLFIWPLDRLPGLFAANPFPIAVNGSLWTLRFEVACYALVLLLGVCGLLNRWMTGLLVGLGLLFLASVGHAHSGVEYITDFSAGAALYFWRPPLRRDLALASASCCCVAMLAGGFHLVAATAGAYLVVYLALCPGLRLPQVTRYGDFSFGIYIYAFPVQQLVAGWLGTGAWVLHIALALPCILALAALSWHGIEKRALQWRNLAGRELPVAAVETVATLPTAVG